MRLKNLKRALRYLAVWSEPVVPEDDMGPAHTLSFADEGAESEARERARKRRTREDGVGRGKGMPDGRRRNRNTQECPSGGPGHGLGEGKGRGKGRFREAQNSDNYRMEAIEKLKQAIDQTILALEGEGYKFEGFYNDSGEAGINPQDITNPKAVFAQSDMTFSKEGNPITLAIVHTYNPKDETGFGYSIGVDVEAVLEEYPASMSPEQLVVLLLDDVTDFFASTYLVAPFDVHYGRLEKAIDALK